MSPREVEMSQQQVRPLVLSVIQEVDGEFHSSSPEI